MIAFINEYPKKAWLMPDFLLFFSLAPLMQLPVAKIPSPVDRHFRCKMV